MPKVLCQRDDAGMCIMFNVEGYQDAGIIIK